MIWIVGNTGAGKTTLAKRMRGSNTIVLDGDDLRTVWKLGLSMADRYEQNYRAGRLAKILEGQGFEVIVSTICPYKRLREELTKMYSPRWIILSGGAPNTEETPFEL